MPPRRAPFAAREVEDTDAGESQSETQCGGHQETFEGRRERRGELRAEEVGDVGQSGADDDDDARDEDEWSRGVQLELNGGCVSARPVGGSSQLVDRRCAGGVPRRTFPRSWELSS